MKIAIVLPAFERPDYSRQSLAALRVALDRQPVTGGLYVSLEPGPEVVRRLYADFVNQPGLRERVGQIRCQQYTTLQGINANILGVLDDAFADGADACISVEDDIVLAPDGLLFFAWALDRFRDDPRILSVTGYHQEPALPPPQRWHEVRTREWVHPWGFGIWRDRWQAMRPHLGRGELTWDCDTNDYRKARGLREVFPVLSRSQNIGVESSGAYGNSPPPNYDPAWFVLKHWAGQVDVPPGAWSVVD